MELRRKPIGWFKLENQPVIFPAARSFPSMPEFEKESADAFDVNFVDLQEFLRDLAAYELPQWGRHSNITKKNADVANKIFCLVNINWLARFLFHLASKVGRAKTIWQASKESSCKMAGQI